jgi:hypothetical protein
LTSNLLTLSVPDEGVYLTFQSSDFEHTWWRCLFDFQSSDFEHTWWRCFQKYVVATKLDIYLFINTFLKNIFFFRLCV